MGTQQKLHNIQYIRSEARPGRGADLDGQRRRRGDYFGAVSRPYSPMAREASSSHSEETHTAAHSIVRSPIRGCTSRGSTHPVDFVDDAYHDGDRPRKRARSSDALRWRGGRHTCLENRRTAMGAVGLLLVGRLSHHGSRIDGDGNRLWGSDPVAVCLDDLSKDQPIVASEESGDIFVVWTDYENPCFKIRAQKMDLEGTRLLGRQRRHRRLLRGEAVVPSCRVRRSRRSPRGVARCPGEHAHLCAEARSIRQRIMGA